MTSVSRKTENLIGRWNHVAGPFGSCRPGRFVILCNTSADANKYALSMSRRSVENGFLRPKENPGNTGEMPRCGLGQARRPERFSSLPNPRSAWP
jgi:hypothetical protein